MQITQSISVDTSVLDALRYCGKQLFRALRVISYYCMLLLAVQLITFVEFQKHPDLEARYEASIDAKFAAMEDAEMIRLAAERKHERILAAKIAKHEAFLEAKRLRVLERKQERMLERQNANATQ